jgi:hypothetical protein
MPVCTYTTLDDPLVVNNATDAFGINAAGQIVGAYGDNTGLHGFLEAGGLYWPGRLPGQLHRAICEVAHTVSATLRLIIRAPDFARRVQCTGQSARNIKSSARKIKKLFAAGFGA